MRVQVAASLRLDAIYRYPRDQGGDDQAERYLIGLFAAFDRLKSHAVQSQWLRALAEEL